MGHVLADSEEEESVPGLTLQQAMAQELGLQPALPLDEMLETATEDLDRHLDQMLQIPYCDTVQDEFLEAVAEANGSSSRIRPPCHNADAETADDADPVTVNPVTVGDSVTVDPATVMPVGDLYSVTFTEVRDKCERRHEKLMRIQEVKEWDRDDGVMVLIHDALQRGDSGSFPEFRGWIVLNRHNELFIHEDGVTSQFLPAYSYKYHLLRAKPAAVIMQSLRAQSLQNAQHEAHLDAQESAATREYRFAPTVDYLKAVPMEKRQETLQIAASSARGSASGAALAAVEAEMGTAEPAVQSCACPSFVD